MCQSVTLRDAFLALFQAILMMLMDSYYCYCGHKIMLQFTGTWLREVKLTLQVTQILAQGFLIEVYALSLIKTKLKNKCRRRTFCSRKISKAP